MCDKEVKFVLINLLSFGNTLAGLIVSLCVCTYLNRMLHTIYVDIHVLNLIYCIIVNYVSHIHKH